MSLASRLVPVLLVSLVAPVTTLAFGGHDSIGCGGCHSTHAAKGDALFVVAPNKSVLNPRTKQPYSGTTALCLGCHEESGKGGQGYAPVHASSSHPYGLASVDPKIAKVPAELLREGGRFECLGCHDPHPSNPNFKYLRVDTGPKGQNMDGFCAVCHPVKADASAAAKTTLFTSMDETGSRAPKAAPAAPAAPAATAPKPAAKPVAPPPPTKK